MNGAARVSTSIKIDDRRDKPASMEQKMQSVADLSCEQQKSILLIGCFFFI